MRDDSAITHIGIAAHICAAAPNGPRYDDNQSQEERSSPSNCIYLCSNHAALVDKNRGIDFSADELRTWKRHHEQYVRSIQGHPQLGILDITEREQTAHEIIDDLAHGVRGFGLLDAVFGEALAAQSKGELDLARSKLAEALWFVDEQRAKIESERGRTRTEYWKVASALAAVELQAGNYVGARRVLFNQEETASLDARLRNRVQGLYRVASNAVAATASDLVQARAILAEMKSAGIPPDVVSYNTLLNFVATEEEARAILEEMKSAGIAPDVVSYSTLLNFVATEEEARAILGEMKSAGIPPNVVSYSTLLNFVATEEEARAILEEMKSAGIPPDVVSYSALLNFVATEEEARAILGEMKSAGIPPNVVSYNTLLNFVATEEEARAILEEMKSAGIPPDVVSYNTLLHFVATEEEARAILEEMKSAGIPPDVVSYSTLLNFVATEEEARGILEEMKSAGIPPNVVSYNTLLNFVATEEEARGILVEMKSAGIPPDVVSYSTLLNFVATEEEARAILEEMKSAGIPPDELTVCTVVKKGIHDLENALVLIGTFHDDGYFAGRAAYEAAFAKSILHLGATELLEIYCEQEFKFETALESPINQYRNAERISDALQLLLTAPHVGAALKFYRQDYPSCRDFFDEALSNNCDEDNLYYASGIAAHLNDDWGIAQRDLTVALSRAYAEKRKQHISELLRSIPA